MLALKIWATTGGCPYEIHTMTFWKNETTFYICAIFITLGIVYSPCLVFQYIYHDEVTLLINHEPFVLHPNFFSEMRMGRPGNAALVTFYDWFLNSIKDVQATRWICLLELSICARLCMTLFQKFLNNPIISFIAAILLFTLPPFQVFISWSGNVAWHTTLLLSTITAMTLYQRLEKYREESIGQFLKRRCILPAILFFLTLLIYPPVAMFYWPMLALVLLGQPLKQQKKSAALFYAAGLLGLSLYAVMLMIFKNIYHKGKGIYNPYDLCVDIFGKIQWFIHEPLTNAFNFHSIYPQSGIAVSWAAFLIIGGSILYFKTKRSFKDILFHSTLVLSLLILSFLPNLLAQANVSFYRCSTALSALIIIAVIWVIRSGTNILPGKIKHHICLIIFLIFFFTGTSKAFSNVLNHRALPSAIELSYIKNITSYLNFDRFQRLHVLRPQPSVSNRYDEFGTLTTSYFHNVAPFFTRVAEENGKKMEFKKPDLTTHFIKGHDYPDSLPDNILAAKRVHVYLKDRLSKHDINLAENAFENELIIDLRAISR